MNKINPNLILPVGTQVVTLIEVRGVNGEPLRREGMSARLSKRRRTTSMLASSNSLMAGRQASIVRSWQYANTFRT